MSNKLISLEKVKRLTTLSSADIEYLLERNLFPIQVDLTPYKAAWVKKEVQEWVEQAIKNRIQAGDAF